MREQTGQQVRDFALVRVPDNPLDAGERGKFLRGALRIAARHQYAAPGIFASRAAHSLPHIVIGRRGDGAGIENYEVRHAKFRRGFKTAGDQLRFERCSICLRRAAAEVLDEKSRQLLLL